MKKSFIILKIFLLGIVAEANGCEGDPMSDLIYSMRQRKKQIKTAISFGDMSLVEVLIINSRNKKRDIENALHYAGKWGQRGIAESFIAAYPNSLAPQPLNELIHGAIKGGYLSIVKFGFEQSTKIKDGPTLETISMICSPLHLAAQHGSNTIARYLIEQGAQLERSAIARALFHEHVATAKELLTAITPSERKKIMTALCALKNGNLDGCEKKFPVNIRQVITLILIDQFTQEHMLCAEELCGEAIIHAEGGDEWKAHLHSHINSIRQPASWNGLTQRVRSHFRRIVSLPKEELILDPAPKKPKIEFGGLRNPGPGY